MKKFLMSAALLASFAGTSYGQWDANWGADNFGGLDGRKDPIETGPGQAKPIRTEDKLLVTYKVEQTTPYIRLCDVVAKVKSVNRDAGMSQIESAYLQKRLLKANRDFDWTVEFDIADHSQGYSFVQSSQVVNASCLRWTNTSHEPNPTQNPNDRPVKLPHDVCNPETDPMGCGNTCKKGAGQSCENDSDPWGSATAGW